MFEFIWSLFHFGSEVVHRTENVIAGDEGLLALGEKSTKLMHAQLDCYIATKLDELDSIPVPTVGTED